MLIQEHIYSPFPRLMTRFALSRGPHRCSLVWRDKSFFPEHTYIWCICTYIHMVQGISCILLLLLLTSSAQGLGRAFAVRLLEAGAK